MLSPREFTNNVELDRMKKAQAAFDHAEIIVRHDELVRKIVSDLSQTVIDLDTLRDIDDGIHAKGKQISQLIHDLQLTVVGSIPNAKRTCCCYFCQTGS